MMSIRNLFLIMVVCLAGIARAQYRSGTIQKIKANKYRFGDQYLKFHELGLVLTKNDRSVRAYEQARSLNTAGIVFGAIGGLGIGYQIGTLIAGATPNGAPAAISPTLMIVSGSVIALGVPFSIVGAGRTKYAVEEYNRSLLAGEIAYDPKLDLNAQELFPEGDTLVTDQQEKGPSVREERKRIKEMIAEERAMGQARIFQYPRHKNHIDSVHIYHDDKLIGSLAPDRHLIWVPPYNTGEVKVLARLGIVNSRTVQVDTQDADPDLFRVKVNKAGEVDLYKVADHLKHDIIGNLGAATEVVRW